MGKRKLGVLMVLMAAVCVFVSVGVAEDKEERLAKRRKIHETRTFALKISRKDNSDYIVFITSLAGSGSMKLYRNNNSDYFYPQEGMKAVTVFDRFNKYKVGFYQFYLSEDMHLEVGNNGTCCTAAPVAKDEKKLNSESKVSMLERRLPKVSMPKEWQEKLKNVKTLQGKVYTVGTSVGSGFSFSIMTKPTEATFLGIDMKGKYADLAVRVVLRAYEKGGNLKVWLDAEKPGYAAAVVAW